MSDFACGFIVGLAAFPIIAGLLVAIVVWVLPPADATQL